MEHWWHNDFASNLKQFKVKGVKIIKSKKKYSKRKVENSDETSALSSASTELSSPPSFDELFEATGGARLGMRARANQKGKIARTEGSLPITEIST